MFQSGAPFFYSQLIVIKSSKSKKVKDNDSIKIEKIIISIRTKINLCRSRQIKTKLFLIIGVGHLESKPGGIGFVSYLLRMS
jgi:hypothetical protein